MSDSDSAVVQTPKVGNAFSNSVGWANSVIHGGGTGNSVAGDIHDVMDPLNINHTSTGNNGVETAAKDTQAQADTNSEQAKNNLDAVSAAYQTAVGSLDVTTSNEIQAALATGDATKAATLLEQAKAGTGIYGIREQNQKQKQLLAVYPGRAQLSPRYNFVQAKAGG